MDGRLSAFARICEESLGLKPGGWGGNGRELVGTGGKCFVILGGCRFGALVVGRELRFETGFVVFGAFDGRFETMGVSIGYH